ncbi:hypothetical protein N7486_003111 [Penicillium sp. IBT 16267x]|nr:hypothetical protein N7486_003111 [Penicillium sp. IBT 16267x]
MASPTDSDGIEFCELENFTFQNGITLPKVRVAYREFNPTGQKVALIPTCFRGTINGTLNFTDGVFQNYRVIVVALLGNGESSSPSNTADFPDTLDYPDCVRAQQKLVTEHLQISSLDVVLGFSMGGQCTYHWAAMYPEMVRNAVVICSSARTSLHNYQFIEGPKAALLHSVDYNDKDLRAKNIAPIRGLHAFARAYSAWLTSAEWFEERLFQKSGFETLDDWAEANAKGYDNWHPDNLLVMAGMWQRSDISLTGDGSKTLEDALGSLTARILLMPCRTDQYFRWEANERELQSIKHGELAVIPSIWGHIGGGGANPVDTEWMDRKIAAFLDQNGPACDGYFCPSIKQV